MKEIQQSGDVKAAMRTLFGEAPDLSMAIHPFAPVPAAEMPPWARTLLEHHDHMTATLREFHGEGVKLNVLDELITEDVYCRSINLALGDSGRIVEYGFVRIDLKLVPTAVREEILQKVTPLGDILIKHDVLRRIDPKWYLRFGADSPLLDKFQGDCFNEAFGRLGVIHCNGHEAIELLEVVPTAGPTADN